MSTDWQVIRKRYPAVEKYTYFNTASFGLMSSLAADCNKTHQDLLTHEGSVYRDTLFEKMQAIKTSIAAFVRAKANNIAFIPNFSTGINAIVPMLRPLQSVLLIEQDYPSLTLPWQVHHFDVHWVSPDSQGVINLDQIEEALRKNEIKILAISWVQYYSGFKVEMEKLGKICQANDTLLVVDATQALGAVPIDLESTCIDILISSCYKWTTAGFGSGILYVRPSVLEQFAPPVIGKGSTSSYTSIYQPKEIDFQPRIFEIGHHNYPALLTLSSVIDELTEIGIQPIYDRILALTQYFKRHLPAQYTLNSDYTLEQSTGIVSLKGKGEKWAKELSKENIIVSARNGLRVSMHFYNNYEEIDCLLQALKKIDI